jgi:hypothetical protein
MKKKIKNVAATIFYNNIKFYNGVRAYSSKGNIQKVTVLLFSFALTSRTMLVDIFH